LDPDPHQIVTDPQHLAAGHRCTLCGRVGSQRGNVQKHVENCHFPGTVLWPCKYCPQTFTTRKSSHAFLILIRIQEWFRSARIRFQYLFGTSCSKNQLYYLPFSVAGISPSADLFFGPPMYLTGLIKSVNACVFVQSR
jgi:hypothetical protein